ncbi:MAG TPA: AAA family ATPase, partial [Candidatus Cloacimonadota bacterium]|nr:AAA family ATPase [Candidatus Cloacimonadota bacterium]
MEQSNIFPDVYNQIYQCLSIKNPKSFFLFAGAGTGKTRALVHTLKQFRLEQGKQLRLCGKKVAVITYTNAACDEIKSRLEYDDTFVISTIHSFSWDLIKPFQNDIRDWVKRNLEIDIIELVEKQSKGRSSKVSSERELQIESKQKRLEYLDHIEKFTYEPNGLNDTKDSLNHNEVISMTAEFLAKKDLLQKILIQQYPILLIDESQDTKKELIEAFFQIQTKYSHSFSLGLLGDTMQRIYFDGKPDLGKFLPDDWLKPNLKINYRSAKRIIVLINRIRSEQAQIPSEGKEEGFVRFFIVNVKGDLDKNSIEQGIMKNMEAITQDEGWLREVKILTLEHNMAARRGGFIEFFEPLYRIEKCKKGLLDGTLPCVSLFLQQIIPLLKAKESKNEFSVAQIMRKYSPLLNLKDFEASSKQIDNIKQADNGVRDLFNLVNGVNKPTLLEILKKIKSSNLFNIPDFLLPILNCSQFDSYITANESDKDEELNLDEQDEI